MGYGLCVMRNPYAHTPYPTPRTRQPRSLHGFTNGTESVEPSGQCGIVFVSAESRVEKEEQCYLELTQSSLIPTENP